MINRPKGVQDILPDKTQFIRNVIQEIIKVVEIYGYKEIVLPIFEHAEVFERSVGEQTDIVEKEIYTFYDKSNRKLALRPEGTAQVVRAYLDNNFKQYPQPVKLFYYGPMFRYERPQKGRFRQFYHFGIEALGEEKPELDVEVIHLSFMILKKLGLKNLFISLNSIGDLEERNAYKERLKIYLRERVDELCNDCKKRLEKNPLRVLDCKRERCINATKDAPKIIDNLSNESKAHFEKILKKLKELNIEYEINHRLVRGLDYYNRTVFEVYSQDLGAQNAILGGGRYDYLSNFLGGEKIPGVGFAIGVERLIYVLENNNLISKTVNNTIYVTPLSNEYFDEAFNFYIKIGEKGFPVYFPYNFKNLKTSLTNCLKMNFKYALIYGGEELKEDLVIFKDLVNEKQFNIKKTEIFEFLTNLGGFNAEK